MSDWRALFSASTGDDDQRMSLRVLRRHGHDLLLLPEPALLAAEALTLYAAQTSLARLEKSILRTALAVGLPMPLAQTEIEIAQTDPLLAWLRELTNETTFAILAGNPLARGRRFIVLAFQAERPAFVIKLGIEAEARALIEREASFLQSVAANVPHLPRLRGVKQTDVWSGLALDFIAGQSPDPQDASGVSEVLGSWVDATRPVALGDLDSWKRLSENPAAGEIIRQLAPERVASTLFHGDFAPWNIRVETHTRQWTVLDWERGEPAGVPGWDWFHYIIQTGILVRRATTAKLIEDLEALLPSPTFKRYAEKAGIAGIEKPLTLAYLRYFLDVINPTEGSPRCEELFQALRASWGRVLDATRPSHLPSFARQRAWLPRFGSR